MSPVRYIRSLFSPYEIAAAGQGTSLLLVAAGLAIFVSGRGYIGLVVLGLLAMAVYWAGYHIGRCTNCGKPALKFFMSGNEQAWDGMLFIRRWWPERECSSCRTRLDVI